MQRRQHIKRTILTVMTLLALALAPAGLGSGTALAAPACPGATENTSKDQVLKGIGETGSNCDDSQVSNTLAAIVQILSLVVGVAAVIVIIIAGFKYMTAGGEASKISNAKNTLIYALIGLIIAALAQFMVNFVLNQAGDSDPACPTNSKIKRSDPKC